MGTGWNDRKRSSLCYRERVSLRFWNCEDAAPSWPPDGPRTLPFLQTQLQQLSPGRHWVWWGSERLLRTTRDPLTRQHQVHCLCRQTVAEGVFANALLRSAIWKDDASITALRILGNKVIGYAVWLAERMEVCCAAHVFFGCFIISPSRLSPTASLA